MIPTSQAYIEMMKKTSLASRIEISVSNGVDTILMTDADIVKDSLTSNWRSSNNGSFSLGTCYATAFSFSAFKTMQTGIEGNSLQITPIVFFRLPEGEQAIPLGIFYCQKPTVFIHTASYECYDAMLKFDKVIPARTAGTPYNVLSFICRECEVELGNTAQSISAMINSSRTLVLDPKRVRTYRDALCYISIILGGYCQIGRDGKLYIRQFHTVYDLELERSRRIEASFAGYRTVFAGVKCRFLANQNFYPYTSGDTQNGIVVDLGDIPIIEDTETVKNAILDEIWGIVQDIAYDPCDITMVGDPSIEAGDLIKTKDRYGYDKFVLLTSVTYNWRVAGQIVSEGANPQIDSVTTSQKKTQQSVENQAQQNTVVTSTYVNAGQIQVTDSGDTEITSLRFITNKDLTAIFGAEIPVYSSGDGYIEITYTDSGIAGDTVRARLHEGYNLVTLVNHLYYEANRVVLLQLKANTEALAGGTAPTVTIAQDTIRSYIFAQGIETEAPWDGIITITENIDYVESQLAVYGITDGVSVEIKVPMENTLSDILQDAVATLQTYGISDTVNVTLEYGDQILRMGEGHRAGMGRMYVRF